MPHLESAVSGEVQRESLKRWSSLRRGLIMHQPAGDLLLPCLPKMALSPFVLSACPSVCFSSLCAHAYTKVASVPACLHVCECMQRPVCVCGCTGVKSLCVPLICQLSPDYHKGSLRCESLKVTRRTFQLFCVIYKELDSPWSPSGAQ